MVILDEVKIFKLNEDDIMSLISKVVAEKMGFEEYSSKSLILGTVSQDLRLIIAVSPNSVQNVDLIELDRNMEFNGEHSNFKGLTDDELNAALDRMIKTGNF